MIERSVEEALQLRHKAICLVCATESSIVGTKKSGDQVDRVFEVARCEKCGFCFVTNPRLDFENVYNEAYYRGEGLDPLVSYSTEMLPNSVRRYEWSGIVDVVATLLDRRPTRWLDYGCGYGGLVKFIDERKIADEVVGFDFGHPIEHAAASGIPVIDSEHLERSVAAFDVVTAIEVLEHVVDPLQTLGQLAGLLSPGGVLFVTTGNAERHRNKVLEWPYLIPEIHMSLYEPRTLECAYRAVGLRPRAVGRSRGMTSIIKYKVLKNLRFKRQSKLLDALPWSLITAMADRREGVSLQPAAIRTTSPVAAGRGDE